MLLQMLYKVMYTGEATEVKRGRGKIRRTAFGFITAEFQYPAPFYWF